MFSEGYGGVTSKMAQWVKTLGTKTDDLSWIPWDTWRNKRMDYSKLSSDLHIGTMACIQPYMYTYR